MKTPIGSGRAQFQLPNNRFDQVTKEPLAIAEQSGREHSKPTQTPKEQVNAVRR